MFTKFLFQVPGGLPALPGCQTPRDARAHCGGGGAADQEPGGPSAAGAQPPSQQVRLFFFHRNCREVSSSPLPPCQQVNLHCLLYFLTFP